VVQSRRLWLAELTVIWMWTPSRLASTAGQVGCPTSPATRYDGSENSLTASDCSTLLLHQDQKAGSKIGTGL
jgi:hypothetical protein